MNTLEPTKSRMETAFVIEATNQVEVYLTQIITSYLNFENPVKEEFFSEILMNNALFSLSSKVKVYIHLSKKNNWPRIKRDHFYTIMSVRNAFAHNPTMSFFMEAEKDENGLLRISDSYMTLESITSSGTLTVQKRSEALSEFSIAYKAVKEGLSTLLETASLA